jgi:hypothetical protein
MNTQEILSSRDDHFSLFKKPVFHEVRLGEKSEDENRYPKFIPEQRNQDDVVEYFKFNERLRRGFSSPFLKINPFENHFALFVEKLEEKYKAMPPSESHVRILAELEGKYRIAMASFQQ